MNLPKVAQNIAMLLLSPYECFCTEICTQKAEHIASTLAELLALSPVCTWWWYWEMWSLIEVHLKYFPFCFKHYLMSHCNCSSVQCNSSSVFHVNVLAKSCCFLPSENFCLIWIPLLSSIFFQWAFIARWILSFHWSIHDQESKISFGSIVWIYDDRIMLFDHTLNDFFAFSS